MDWCVAGSEGEAPWNFLEGARGVFVLMETAVRAQPGASLVVAHTQAIRVKGSLQGRANGSCLPFGLLTH